MSTTQVKALTAVQLKGLSTTDIALSAHLVMPGGHPGDAFLAGIADELHTRFHITHPTVQIELDGLDHGCAHPTGNSMS